MIGRVLWWALQRVLGDGLHMTDEQWAETERAIEEQGARYVRCGVSRTDSRAPRP